MGILQSILNLFKKKEALQLESERVESFGETRLSALTPEEKMLQLDKEALQLGVAAGYTGRSLKNIEDSLLRIESLMVTKDWFKTEFQDIGPQIMQTLQFIKQLIEDHEIKEQSRFEKIVEALNKLESTAYKAPEPIKKEILTQVEKIKVELPLTERMEKILNILKERKEISFQELAQILGYKHVSTVRGLVSLMKRRIDQIETFRVNREGWVRLKEG
jgi:GTP cyclohydrolase II